MEQYMADNPGIRRSGSLWRILVADSARDLIQVKSLFGLLLFLLLIDRVLKFALRSREGSQDSFPALLKTVESNLPDWVFGHGVDMLLERLVDPRSLLIALMLFLLKELLSLWPTSAMRRLHREEGRGFGIVASLVALRWRQVWWDFSAVGVTTLVVSGLILLAWLIANQLWIATGWVGCAWFFAVVSALVLSLCMAAFSFSSKLAVLSTGTRNEKMRWFMRLFYVPRLLFPAWLFFIVRASLETAVLAALPILLHFSIESVWLRLLLGTMVAAPVYSYLKMVSFKLFLELYRECPFVFSEYREYFTYDSTKALS
jgi:hypothetical protein